jgi:two-component system sensor histidine kinase SenX3
VWDEAGAVVLRNRPDPDLALPHSGQALIDAAVDDLVQTGVAPEPVTRTLDLRGPPPRQLVLRALPLHHEEECLGAVAIVDDVSERRQLEAVRRDFVANVSHELRTPVGALALLGEALSGESDPEVVSRLARRITAEADRAARISRISSTSLASRGAALCPGGR